jgi:hypothetical protein
MIQITSNGHSAVHHPTDEAIDVLYSWMPGTAPAPQPCPEACLSLTLKGTIDGHEALLTARGQTPTEFLRNLQAIRGLLDTPAAATRPQAQGRGQDAVSEAEGYCTVHDTAMRRVVKNGRSWLSHWCESEGRYCHGK